MQWLIDLVAQRVIDTIGIPPTYVDRGEHSGHDWLLGDLTVDGSWHDIDMSLLVPAGAKGVNLHSVCVTSVITDIFYLKPKSHGTVFGSCTLRPQVINHSFCVRRAFAIDSDRVMEYRFIGSGFSLFQMSVKGWWL